VETLTFRSRHDYSLSRTGIEVPVILKAPDGRSVRLSANVDTGASFCIFKRDYAEQLGLDVETGVHKVVSTATGRLDVYGHTLTLSCLEWEFETMVYFAAPSDYRRDVLGRSGWLERFRLGLVEHDALLFLSGYDD
jgi:hypothetical protein